MSQRIDPEEVDRVFRECLFKQEEVSGGKVPENAVIVDGILTKVGFHRERLESHRAEVKGWLELLPIEFHKSGGGGWIFLNACNQSDGEQWTGLHQRMEQLFMLGIGLNLARWQLPGLLHLQLPGIGARAAKVEI